MAVVGGDVERQGALVAAAEAVDAGRPEQAAHDGQLPTGAATNSACSRGSLSSSAARIAGGRRNMRQRVTVLVPVRSCRAYIQTNQTSSCAGPAGERGIVVCGRDIR